MTEDEKEAPFVPDVRDRNRPKPQSLKDVDGESVKEEMDALEKEAPFVPMISKRRDSRIKKAKEKQENED